MPISIGRPSNPPQGGQTICLSIQVSSGGPPPSVSVSVNGGKFRPLGNIRKVSETEYTVCFTLPGDAKTVAVAAEAANGDFAVLNL